MPRLTGACDLGVNTATLTNGGNVPHYLPLAFKLLSSEKIFRSGVIF
ncbi:MAG TPA: hypothetical protein VKM55_21685 [Candidatus Lokiarchaeia archaeon]|nr:hypothetical protein [Candidatus Lokiarchaeia archaeon]